MYSLCPYPTIEINPAHSSNHIKNPTEYSIVSRWARIKFTAFRLIYYKYYRIRIMRKFVTN
jgi:hypothetical protein